MSQADKEEKVIIEGIKNREKNKKSGCCKGWGDDYMYQKKDISLKTIFLNYFNQYCTLEKDLRWAIMCVCWEMVELSSLFLEY